MCIIGKTQDIKRQYLLKIKDILGEEERPRSTNNPISMKEIMTRFEDEKKMVVGIKELQ